MMVIVMMVLMVVMMLLALLLEDDTSLSKVVPGSVAEKQGGILPNDQVIEVDGLPLSGYCNQEAVELLKLTGARVRLKICRYLRGLKFEQLQDGVIHRREEQIDQVLSSVS